MRTFLLAPLLAAACAGEAPLPAAAGPDAGKPRIQVAILLDDSGSMSGLIAQAKTQLWDMINQLAATTHRGRRPIIEVALYHYGDLPFAAQPLLPLSTDLDAVSQSLESINGGGGLEACGTVIRNAVAQLHWSDDRNDLKLILIAGNEPFTQGSVAYRDACAEAIAKGIQVNTIHCGDEATGRAGEWHLGAALADGQFLNIDHNRIEVAIAAPQDAQIGELNAQLNGTYLGYGAHGKAYAARQNAQDAAAAGNQSFAARAVSKSSLAYGNAHWDLVDACSGTSAAAVLGACDATTLPAVLQGKTLDEQTAIISAYSASRAAIQARIRALGADRAAFIAKAEQEQAAASGKATFGQAVRQAIAAQAAKKGYGAAPAATAPAKP